MAAFAVLGDALPSVELLIRSSLFFWSSASLSLSGFSDFLSSSISFSRSSLSLFSFTILSFASFALFCWSSIIFLISSSLSVSLASLSAFSNSLGSVFFSISLMSLVNDSQLSSPTSSFILPSLSDIGTSLPSSSYDDALMISSIACVFAFLSGSFSDSFALAANAVKDAEISSGVACFSCGVSSVSSSVSPKLIPVAFSNALSSLSESSELKSYNLLNFLSFSLSLWFISPGFFLRIAWSSFASSSVISSFSSSSSDVEFVIFLRFFISLPVNSFCSLGSFAAF